jgi:hypothetical protein
LFGYFRFLSATDTSVLLGVARDASNVPAGRFTPAKTVCEETPNARASRSRSLGSIVSQTDYEQRLDGGRVSMSFDIRLPASFSIESLA